MRKQKSGFFKFFLILVLTIMSIRLLPVVARLLQPIAVAVRAYWWIILPAAFALWARWKWKRRRFLEDEQMRDVTGTAASDT